MEALTFLKDLAASPVGTAVLGIVAMSVVYATFAVARALLNRFRSFAKTTDTKIDDAAADLVGDALDAAERRALNRVDPPKE